MISHDEGISFDMRTMAMSRSLFSQATFGADRALCVSQLFFAHIENLVVRLRAIRLAY